MSERANNSLQRAWQARNQLYMGLYGPRKYVLPKRNEAPLDVEPATISNAAELASIIGNTLSVRDISIVAHEPNELRPYWLFASSGLSNPWFGQSDEVSGFGCELVLKTKTPGRWTIKLMRRLVYYIISGGGTLSPGVMLKIDAPLFADEKKNLGGIIVWYADEAPDCIYELPSGKFGIFSIIGISEDESDFVESVDKYGCWCIQQILREAGYEQLTEPSRPSMMKIDDMQNRIRSLHNYLENFGFIPGQA
jgi:hypothetical protein